MKNKMLKTTIMIILGIIWAMTGRMMSNTYLCGWVFGGIYMLIWYIIDEIQRIGGNTK